MSKQGANRKLTRETLNSLARPQTPLYAQGAKTTKKELRVRGLRERNGNWHFRLKWQGKEVSGDTELPARQDMVNAAIAIREQALRDLKNPPAKKAEAKRVAKSVPDAVIEFVDWYTVEHSDKPKTWKWAKSSLAAFRLYFEESTIDELTPAQMEQFKMFQHNRGLKRSSVAHSLKAVNMLCRHGRKMGWLSHNPLEDVSIPSQGDSDTMHVLSPSEETSYYEWALKRSVDLADLMRVMVQQGCRPEEVLTLEQDSVDIKRNKFEIVKVLVSDKRGVTCKSFASQRTLPMTPEVRAIFERRKDGKSRWMFPSTRRKGAPITTLQKAHEWVVARTGIPCRIYDFRHTYATRLAVRGCPLPQLGMSMGHSDLSMLRKYVHPGQEDMERALMAYGAAADQMKALGFTEWTESGSRKSGPKSGPEVDGGPLTGAKWGGLRRIPTKKNEDAA